jgi:YbbR domain-containing protein
MKFVVMWFVRLVTRNFLWKVLALALGIGIWTFVSVEPELSVSIPVLMEYDGLSEDLEIGSMMPANNTVTLEVIGPTGAVRGIGEKGGPRVSVVLDMKSARPGISTYSIGGGNVRLAHGLRLVRAVPAEARFEFERRTDGTVPVTVRFRGEGENGHTVASFFVSPSALDVTGPSSHVKSVAAATTDPVDVSRAQGTVSIPVNAYVGDPYVRFRTQSLVVVTVTMKKR